MNKKIVFAALALAGVGLVLAFLNRGVLKDVFVVSSVADFYMENFRDGAAVDEEHLVATMDNGMEIVVNRKDRVVCRFIRLVGYWDRNETAVLKKLVQPGWSVVEVGSNFGVHTLRMAELVGAEGKIFGFEANPRVSKYLQMSVEKNQLTDSVKVYHNAASDRAYDGFMVYDLNNIGGGHIFAANQASAEICKNPRKVCAPIKVVTLDQTLPDQKIDLLKMDAEGAEPWILGGGFGLMERNKDHLVLMMEWGTEGMTRNGLDPEKLLNRLKGYGFQFWIIRRNESIEPIEADQLLKLPRVDIIASKQDVYQKYFQ